MDCRWTLSLAAALLAAVAGCDMKTLPLWPSADALPTPKLPPKDLPKSTDDEVDERPKEIKPETVVAFAAFKEQCALELGESAPAEKERLLELARQGYQEALEMDPKNLKAFMSLAGLYEKMGDNEHAVATYRQASKVMPKDKTVWFESGMYYGRQKEWDRAVEDLRKASALDPDDRHCAKTLGLVLARAGRFEESFSCLEHKFGQAEAHCIVARMLHHMKQDDAARAHVQMALQINSDLPSAQELLTELAGGPGAVGTFVGRSELPPVK